MRKTLIGISFTFMNMQPAQPKAIDPTSNLDATVSFVQPFAARKTYLCPACSHDIVPGTGHYVIVPDEAPDLRRHWHRHCWERRHTNGVPDAKTTKSTKKSGF